MSYFIEYYNYCDKFVKLSSYIGERFDLVQAGGGNTSFKFNDIMYIKSSGCNLSDIHPNKNCVGVNYKNIKNNLIDTNFDNIDKKDRENKSKYIVDQSIYFLKQYKPSIETTLHTLTKTFTVHIHPIQFNLISALPNCEKILNNLFQKCCIIEYFTPGIDVTIELFKKYNNENIIFLKNHGVVFSSDTVEEMYSLINDTMNKLEKLCNINLNKYKFVNEISNIMTNLYNTQFVTYLSEDVVINNFLKYKLFNNNIINNESLDDNIIKPFFPDKFVYCGTSIVLLNDNIELSINEYEKKYNEIPIIFITKSLNIYISSHNIKKCYEIESVLKSHLICCNIDNILLDNTEINYLSSWDAEKYRKCV